MDTRNLSARLFLFSSEGKVFLEREYTQNQRSTHELAEERKTYHKLVLQALRHHRIVVRDRGEAQSSALVTGRAPHPTAGKQRPKVTRDRIRQSLLTKTLPETVE